MEPFTRRQLSHYHGRVFRRQAWRELAPGWDHDHCVGCMKRFSDRPDAYDDATLTEGWVTLYRLPDSPAEPPQIAPGDRLQAGPGDRLQAGPGYRLQAGPGYRLQAAPAPNRYQLEWMCPECFEQAHDELGLIIDPDHPMWAEAGL